MGRRREGSGGDGGDVQGRESWDVVIRGMVV
jgi:hypothetical protein